MTVNGQRSSRTRELTILATMAAVSATLEATMGTYLHTVHFPLVGAVMVALDLIVYTIGYMFVPRRGTVVLMGTVTALPSILMGGPLKTLALPAIVLEAALVDVVFSLFNLSLSGLVVAGVTANLFTLAWFITIGSILAGRKVSSSVMAYSAANSLHAHGLLFALIVIVMFHVACGAMSGLMSWKVVCSVDRATSARGSATRLPSGVRPLGR